MNLESITNTVLSAGSVVFETVKDAVLWAGHVITTGASKAASLVQALWDKTAPLLREVACKVCQFLRTGPGLAVAGGAAGYGLLSLANSKSLEGDELAKQGGRLLARAGAVACFVGAGVAVGLSFTRGFTTPLVS